MRIATSSCTGALHMGLSALGIKPGDELILADTNWIASVAPITYLGATPVFVDVLPDTWCIDPEKAETAITPQTRAIIAVHLYGNLCTGLGMWRTDSNPAGGISFVPNAYCYRCPLNLDYPACDLACAEAVARVIETATSGEVAALIAEPIQGNGGIITPPPEYFRRVKEILNKYGALLIINEVQSGFGRTGKWFAIEHWGVEPEIMTVAKALGNGVPIGAFIAVPEVADRYTRPGSSTLGGNPVSMTAGLATLDVIEKERLAENAAELGASLKGQLLELKDRHPLIGDVRGLGLMLGAELVKNGQEPASAETDRVLELMKNRGIIIGKNGRSRNVLAFQPPLVITGGDVEEMLHQLDDVLTEVEGK